MVDFEFYANTYLGSAIPEKAFSAMALRATHALNGFRRSYQILPTDGISEKMALCAMAEVFYGASRQSPGVTAATVGSVSVRYGQDASRSLQRKLLEQAKIYLDIYRGARR